MGYLKTAIVTGASTGIGRETALLLSKNGYFVYAVARSEDLLNEIKSDAITPIVLDVTDDDAVTACVDKVLEERGRIDLLVNNAGYAQLGTTECVSIEAIKRQFDVNLFGYIRFIQAVLPSMRNRQSGRIINVTSAVGKVSMPLFGWYAGTKHAIEAMSDALREEVRDFNIGVSIIEPGVIDTPFLPLQAQLLKEETPHDPAYNKLLNTLPKLVPERNAGAHPKVIGKVILKAAKARRAPIRVAAPMDSKAAIGSRRLLGDDLFFMGVRKAWKL